MHVLCLLPVNASQAERIEAACPDDTVTFIDRNVVTDEQVAAAEVIIGNLDPARVRLAQGLKLMQLNSAASSPPAPPSHAPRAPTANRSPRTCLPWSSP